MPSISALLAALQAHYIPERSIFDIRIIHEFIPVVNVLLIVFIIFFDFLDFFIPGDKAGFQ